MADSFLNRSVELDSPGRSFAAITPNDAADIPMRPRSLWVGVGGNLACQGTNGNTTVFVNLLPGWHPISPVRILATDTTASSITGIW